jgi:hypothetical protein
MAGNSKDAVNRANQRFMEGKKAMTQYVSEAQKLRDKTARLKSLRMDKEAADREAKALEPPKEAKKKRAPRVKPSEPVAAE